MTWNGRLIPHYAILLLVTDTNQLFFVNSCVHELDRLNLLFAYNATIVIIVIQWKTNIETEVIVLVGKRYTRKNRSPASSFLLTSVKPILRGEEGAVSSA
jgi:hypothetical protein